MMRAASLATALAAAMYGQTIYTLTTAAGSGMPGFAGDGGAATAALLNRPCAVAVAADGTLYVADSLNHRVRRIHNGKIDTAAGSGVQGFAGDGGGATAAQLNTPCGLAVDASGNLYIADTANHRVRKVAGGTITTVAGNGTGGLAGDGGPAASARLNYPLGLAVDSAGVLYIADSANHRIRKVAGGTITTFAGTSAGYAGDGGAATAARLSLPGAIASGAGGDWYILDSGNSRVRRVRGGIIATVAGGGIDGIFRDPRGMDADAAGNVIVADSGNQRVRSISTGGNVSAIAGNGTSGTCGEGLPALAAQLGAPYGVAFAGATIYAADYRNNRVVALTPGGQAALLRAPHFEAGGLLNAASHDGPAVAPGEIIAISGSGLGPAATAGTQLASNGTIDTQAGGARVYFDGRAAPMLFASAAEVGAIVPYDVAGQACTVVEAEYNGVRSKAVAIPVRDHAPGIFALNSEGAGPGAVLNQDLSINSATHPAARGSTIIFFGTGEGQTNPPGVDGLRAPGTPPQPAVMPAVRFGTLATGNGTIVTAQQSAAAGVPGFAAGLLQYTVTVPPNAPTGPAVPLYVFFGNSRSRTDLTVAIR
jgi:uncharacterized protein (TIGR03437 family)